MKKKKLKKKGSTMFNLAFHDLRSTPKYRKRVVKLKNKYTRKGKGKKDE